MKLLKILVFLSLAGATVTDIDGNVYETVLIRIARMDGCESEGYEECR